MKISCLTIGKQLNDEFRAKIAEKKELKKGCIRECVEEAIREWISKDDVG